MNSSLAAACVTVVLLSASPSLSPAGIPGGYFPEIGKGALAQRARDLRTSACVVMIAPEPGAEDIATLTLLRMDLGARVVAVYLTDGGGTSSDDADDIPYVAAGRRMEEATRTLSTIGCTPWFLNCPGAIPGAAGAAALRDTVARRVAGAIERFRPDVVLIAAGWRKPDPSLDSVFLPASIAAIRVHGERPGGAHSWNVSRVFVECDSSAGALEVNAHRMDPVWNKSYLSIARESWSEYASLRMTLRARSAQGVHWYNQVLPARAVRSASLLGGLPRLTPGLARVDSAIALSLALEEHGDRRHALVALAEALARIENLIVRRRGNLLPLEERVLARWKDGLEDYRCSLRGITADIQPSDSIMSDRQLFYLHVRSAHLPVPERQAEIFFPLAGGTTWAVNESRTNHFPLKTPSDFRVLTPEKIPWNYPSSLYGLGSSELVTMFPYYIVHRDSDRALNFAYRRDVPLRTAPGRALQVLTPVVRMRKGEDLAFALYNITRQSLKAEAWVKDSIIGDSRIPVTLSRKDEIALNRIPLAWRDSAFRGDHIAEIHIGRVVAGRFLVRAFDIGIDTSATVGLISAFRGGTLESTLRTLGMRYVVLDSSLLARGAWTGCTVVIVDRNALSLWEGAQGAMPLLRSWVEGGGRVLIFPQSVTAGIAGDAFPEIRFAPGSLPADASVDMSGTLVASPNALTTDDWEGWQCARADEHIVTREGAEAAPLVQTKDDHTALVARVGVGQGFVTGVALDIHHQLETLHIGACRIFANLLSR